MTDLFDKIILFLFCCVFAISNTDNLTVLISLIIAVTVASLSGYFSSRYLTLGFSIGSLILCFFLPEFLYFLPLVGYDLFMEDSQFVLGFIFLPMLVHYDSSMAISFLLIIVLLGVSYLLKNHTYKLNSLHRNYINLRDETTEAAEALRQKNFELMEKQDYEINLATLNERNRIAGEIHDNIGHLLSSSILQVGALMTITKDPATKESLKNIKNTLSTGMDNIRNSIHNIHEDSMDLHTKLQVIVTNFIFCTARLDYRVDTDLDLKTKYSILFIVKETLSNVMKHSNATEVQISFIEYPGFYQLIVLDNGKAAAPPSINNSGMGLNNIRERVSTLNGNIHIDTDHGYKVFISLPKEEV